MGLALKQTSLRFTLLFSCLALFAIAVFAFETKPCINHLTHIKSTFHTLLKRDLIALAILVSLAFSLPRKTSIERKLYWIFVVGMLSLVGMFVYTSLRAGSVDESQLAPLKYLSYFLGATGFASQLSRLGFRTQMCILIPIVPLLVLVILLPLLVA